MPVQWQSMSLRLPRLFSMPQLRTMRGSRDRLHEPCADMLVSANFENLASGLLPSATCCLAHGQLGSMDQREALDSEPLRPKSLNSRPGTIVSAVKTLGKALAIVPPLGSAKSADLSVSPRVADSGGICSCGLSSIFSALPHGLDVFCRLLLRARAVGPSGR